MIGLLEDHAPGVLRWLLDLLYPPKCAGCGRQGEGWWCTSCHQRTRRLPAESNVRTLHTPEGAEIKVVSACAYAAPLQDGIHRYKYEGTPQLHTAFSRMMAAAWRAHAQPGEVFVPVPLHPKRQRERGFNQSALLAADVAKIGRGAMLDGALIRTRPTQQQAKLSADERHINMRGAFVAQRQAVAGKRVVVVDDVFTTGATLIACAEALLAAGAAEMAALTLARA